MIAAALAQMRTSSQPVHYLVGTPKVRINRMEAALAERPWVKVRGLLRVKSVPEDGEVYVLIEVQRAWTRSERCGGGAQEILETAGRTRATESAAAQ